MAQRVLCAEEGCEASVAYPPTVKDNPNWCIWKDYDASIVRAVYCPLHIPEGFAQHCSEPSCLHNVSMHYWGKVTASNAGWFFQRTGEAWCPEHVPEWVTEWRARRDASRDQLRF